jgi:hypothetical protein
MQALAPIILVCGSRRFRGYRLVVEVVEAFDPETVVISGGAEGPDRWAASAASKCGMHVAVVRPLWHRYGKAAGHRRNAAMMRLSPSHVVAFWDGASAGTKGTIDLARAAGIPTTVYAEDGSSRLIA